MTATVYVTVEDVAAQLAALYTRIELHSAASVGGAYSLVANTDLVAGDYTYSLEDAAGDLNTFYKYRFTAAGGGAPLSAFSNPFQPEGVTRKKIRQYAITNYRQGVVLAAAGSGSSTSVPLTDYRFKSSIYRTNRGKGSWLHPTTGSRALETRIISATDPANGTFTVSPALSGALAAADEFEWHWLADPDEWNGAINRAADRYYQLERVPIVCVAGQEEFDLTEIAPWLRSKEDIFGLWHYPLSDDATPDADDEPFQGNGRWWRPRQDGATVTLVISPAQATGKHLYLEAARPMPKLHTDASVGPAPAAVDLWAALAYDEMMDLLSRPGTGASKDRSAWERERARHRADTLVPLLRRERLKPRGQPPQLPTPANAPRAWSAR